MLGATLGVHRLTCGVLQVLFWIPFGTPRWLFFVDGVAPKIELLKVSILRPQSDQSVTRAAKTAILVSC